MASFTVVPKDAATETETQSDVPAVAPEPQTHQKRRVLVGFVATAALLATGAAVAATKSSTTAQWKNSAGAVSKYVDSHVKTGCANWEALNLKFITGTSRSECDKACHDFNAGSPAAKCEAFNFLPSDQCTGDRGGLGAGSCYLFKGGCNMKTDDCWDYYTIAGSGGSNGCKGNKQTWEGRGCSDWKAQMISLTKVDTRAKCDEECEKNSACKYANYQPGNCQANAAGGSNCVGGACDAYPGACYLFKGCNMEGNTCWDLTEFGCGPSTTVTVTTTTTSTTDKPPARNR
jgi:hypothetical protein